MKTMRFFVIFFLSIFVISCSKEKMLNPTADDLSLKSAMPFMKIAVLSDLHYLDPSLMVNCTTGVTEFTTEMKTSNKIIQLSDPILKEAVAQIVAEKPDILLIAGDLTKDGEKISHETVAGILEQIEDQGIKVFVVPGNHDVLNLTAKAYNGAGSSLTANITPEEFAGIYSDFGYAGAISRDDNSLSYIAQPFNKVWIVGLDACKYFENTASGPKTSGKLKAATMEWLIPWLEKAKKNNITVLGLMHHGTQEVCTGQETFYKGYVFDNGAAGADALSSAGLRVIFTGHLHSNDITMRENGENTLFDIKTGSLVTPPCPFRIINMNPNFMDIDTRHITSIDADIPGGVDFVTYSNAVLTQNMTRLFKGLFMSSYGLDLATATAYSPYYAKALNVLYASEGVMSAEDQEFANGLPTLFKNIFMSLYTDLPPSDLQYNVDMRKKLR
jgi:3',5'-cyclic AMP phosphodiesterase CpdA